MYHLLVWQLLRPFSVLYLVTALAILNLWRKRRETRRRLLGLTITFAVLTLFCLPPVAHLAVGSLEWSYPPLAERPADVEAIVVLSSGLRFPNGPGGHAELGEDSLARCLKAAEMYRQGPPCPVVATGRQADVDPNVPACSEVMRDFLVQHGVPAGEVTVESHALTTYENAVECRKLLEARQIRKILLVSTASHLARAVGCFRKQGLEVVPCGCGYEATQYEVGLAEFFPSLSAALKSERACHEWLGLAWYGLRGRL